MGVHIPSKVLSLKGQVVRSVEFNESSGRVRIVCDRDRRHKAVDHSTGQQGSVNRLLRRTIQDVPIGGSRCEIEIEYAETFVSQRQVRVEELDFVLPKSRVTKRYARMVAGMSRHMPISAVARHTGLSWDSVKAIECAHLAETIAPPDPKTLSGITRLGVDEVARSKGHNYFTLVYDLSEGANYGRILWIKEGKDSSVLLEFLKALSPECANEIKAVAMDMGPAYICAVKQGLPHAAIVFDRFHVMQLFSKVIRSCRRAEFKEAKTLGNLEELEAIKGSLFLLLGNRKSLKDTDKSRLDKLLAMNQPLFSLYTLKEQLQRLWDEPGTPADMAARLDDWCGIAKEAKINGLSRTSRNQIRITIRV